MNDNGWFSIDPKLSPYYSANLALFQKYDPEQAAWVDGRLEDVSRLEFLKLGDDQYACRAPGSERPFYEPLSFHEHLNRELERIGKSFSQGVELAVISGSGLGYLAAHAEEDIRDRMGLGLLLLESRADLIASQFCLFDCRAILRSNQVFWAVGETLFDAVQKVFERFRFDLIPRSRIALLQERWLAAEEREPLQQVGKWIAQNWQKAQTKLQQARERFNAAMKQPAQLSAGRIWSAATPDAYAHTPLIRSLLSGFHAVGWQSQLFEIPTRFANRYPISESMEEFIPDVVLTCNAADESSLANEFARPRLIWILDHPRYYAGDSLRRSLSKYDYVFYADRFYGDELESVNARICQFLPVVPSAPRRGERRADLAAPIVFVGSYKDASQFYQSLPGNAAAEVFHLLDEMIRTPTKTGCQHIQEAAVSESTVDILRRKASEFTRPIRRRLPDWPRQVDYFLYSLANSRKRERVIRSLLDLGIVVYGPDSWLKLLGERYASQYRGWLNNEDLSDVYASAEAVLNLHSLQCPTCLNCRDFDVLAAGGCLLSDWVEDMDLGYLTPNRDCVVVRKDDNLVETAKELLGDPSRRFGIREEGYGTYCQRHTSRHRAEEMIETMRKYYNQKEE